MPFVIPSLEAISKTQVGWGVMGFPRSLKKRIGGQAMVVFHCLELLEYQSIHFDRDLILMTLLILYHIKTSFFRGGRYEVAKNGCRCLSKSF
jgi:hypothetical protein